MGVLNLADWARRALPRVVGNRERGRIELEAQGRDWILRLNMNHLLSLCQRFDLPDESVAETLMKLAARMGTVGGLRTAMWFALIEHHPEVSLQQAGAIITEVGFERSGELILETLHWAMPRVEPEKGEAGRGKGEAASTGGPTTS